MANAVKLLNWIDLNKKRLKFYTELDSDFKIGDKVFIVGGNYDNSIYSDVTNTLYDPYHKYACGYTIMDVDTTSISNAITLDIDYTDTSFSSGGLNSSIFNPLPVYKKSSDLLFSPNQTRESWISKSYFKSGEFNGGTFDGGIFGTFDVNGEKFDVTWSRISEVNNLIQQLENGIFDELSKDDYLSVDYTVVDDFKHQIAILEQKKLSGEYDKLQSPVKEFSAIFNNKFENTPAQFINGVVIGADFKWGTFNSKYPFDKPGKIQVLNDNNNIKSLTNSRLFNIQSFVNNNDGFGYSYFVSGNIGRIFKDNIFLSVDSTINIITFNYIPYELNYALRNGYSCQIEINSIKNNRIFDVIGVYPILPNSISISNITTVNKLSDDSLFTIQKPIYTESGIFTISIYIKNSSTKPLFLNNGTFLQPDIFSGVFDNNIIKGGDIFNGEFRKTNLLSEYEQLFFRGGIINGVQQNTFLEDVRFEDGYFIDGNWKGDSIFKILNITNTTSVNDKNRYLISISEKYKHLFRVDENIFISYVKRRFINQYLNNYEDVINKENLNFAEFKLINVYQDEIAASVFQYYLEVEGNITQDIIDINLEFARVSQSYFKNGYWYNGLWQSGLRKINPTNVISIDGSTGVASNLLYLTVNNSSTFNIGDVVKITNLNLIRDLSVDFTTNVLQDNITNAKYIQYLDLDLVIINILSNSITIKIPQLDYIKDSLGNVISNGTLLNVDYFDKKYAFTSLYKNIWYDGEFKAGAWQNGYAKKITFDSNLFFDISSTQINTIIQSGWFDYIISNNCVFLSGVWKNGIFNNGIFTNVFNNIDINLPNTYNAGDSIWYDGVFNNGLFKRGIMKKSTVNNGILQNGTFEDVNFVSGQYANGLSLYDSSISQNRSGQQIDNKWDSLTAPSVTSIDGDGWVTLDQQSYYQKGYNVIFQDLNKHINPFNNQMFTVKNRDEYGQKIQISYSSLDSDNPISSSNEFLLNKPLLVLDNIVDFTENVNGKYYIAEATRIFELDSINNKVEIFGNILNTPLSNYNFTQIKLLTGGLIANDLLNNPLDTIFFYYVEGNNIKYFDNNEVKPKVLNTLITDIKSNEVIIDMHVLPRTANLSEVLLVLVQGVVNRILYWSPDFGFTTIMKSIFLNTTLKQITNVVNFTATRITSTNRINLFLNYTTTIRGFNKNNVFSCVEHMVLNFTNTNQTYSLLSNVIPIKLIEFTSALFPINGILNYNPLVNTVKKLVTITSSFRNNYVFLYLVVEENGIQDVYIYEYKFFFLGGIESNPNKLNSSPLEYPINKIKIDSTKNNLLLIGQKDGDSVYFSKRRSLKNTIGFADNKSQIKFFDIFQSINSLTGTGNLKYWYYDKNITAQENRVLYVDESTKNDIENPYFNPTLNLDRLELNSTVLKFIGGHTPSQIYTIELSTSNKYQIRRTTNFSNDSENTDFLLNGEGISNPILDGCVAGANIIFVNDNLSGFLNIKIYLGNTSTSLDTTIPYINNKVKMDFVNVPADLNSAYNYIGLLYNDGENKLYSIKIKNNSIDVQLIETIPNIVDLTVQGKTINLNINGGNLDDFKETYEYQGYIATSNSVIKIVSDSFIHSTENSWTKINSVNNDVVYEGIDIREVYRNSLDRIIIKVGDDFVTVKQNWTETDYPVEEVVFFNNYVKVLSEGRLSYNFNFSTNTTLLDEIGEYRQNSQSDKTMRLFSNPRGLYEALFDKLFITIGNDNLIRAYYKNTTFDLNLGFAKRIFTNTGFFYKDFSADSATEVFGLTVESNPLETKVVPITITTSDDGSVFTMDFTNDISFLTITGIQTLKISSFYETLNLNRIAVLCAGNIIKLYNQSSYVADLNYSSLYTDRIVDLTLSKVGSRLDLYFVTENINLQKTLNYTYSNQFNGTTWETPSAINGFINNIQSLNETKYTYPEFGQGTSGNVPSVMLSDKKTGYLLRSGTPDENLVFVNDFTFNVFDLSSPIYFYNSQTVGVIRVNNLVNQPLKSILDISRNISLNGVGFKKIVSTTNGYTYTLFNDGIYETDFNTNTANLLLNPSDIIMLPNQLMINISVEYIPSTISISNNELVCLFEIKDSSTSSNAFIPLTYDRVTSTWLDNLDSLYNIENGIPLSINLNGSTDTLLNNTFIGIKHLIKSSIIKPLMDIKKDTFYLYKQHSTDISPDYIKIVKNVNLIQNIQHSAYSDLIFKVDINSFNSEVESLVSATITHNESSIFVNGTNSTYNSTSFITNSYSLGAIDYIGGTSGSSKNQFIVTFIKPIGQLFNLASTSGNPLSLSFKFSTNNAIQTINTQTNILNYSGVVYDFKVYESTSGTGSKYDIFAIRPLISNTPINIDNSYNGYWKLQKGILANWNIFNPITGLQYNFITNLNANIISEVVFERKTKTNNPITLSVDLLPKLDTSFNFDELVKGYKVNKTIDENKNTQILRPYLTSRILEKSNIRTDVGFNIGGTTNSAHLVSSKWLSGSFVGSWDTPRYIDNKYKKELSYFIDGTFTGNFYNGFILGGTVNANSTISSANIISDNKNINLLDVNFNSSVRFDIREAIWDSNILTIKYDSINLQNNRYVKVNTDLISRGSLIRIPSLFKEISLSINKIIKYNLDIESKQYIILQLDNTFNATDTTWSNYSNLYNDKTIFIESDKNVDVLYGEYYCKKSWIEGNFLYLLINSSFNLFNNGEYIPNSKLNVVNNKYFRVVNFISGEITLKLEKATISSDDYKFIQWYYLKDNIDIMNEGIYKGYLVMPDHLQFFINSFEKGTYKLNASILNELNFTYVKNVISTDASSIISIKKSTQNPISSFVRDILNDNSWITLNIFDGNSLRGDWLENNIFNSGRTDRNWKSGAWLNQDERGFNHANSQFGFVDTSSNVLNVTFDGNPVKINTYGFEGNGFIWIELNTTLSETDVNRWITIRGFNGNKSYLLGNTISKVFRIEDVNGNFIKIKSPFKYYTGITESINKNLTNFNASELSLKKQIMKVKTPSLNNDNVKLTDIDSDFTFDYGWVSASCFNGGDFYGQMNSVFNSGNFRGGEVTSNGKWFAQQENQTWTGQLSLTSTKLLNSYNYNVALNGVSVKENDLIWFKISPQYDNGIMRDIEDGRYFVVQTSISGLFIQYNSQKFVPTIDENNIPILYGVNIVRMRTSYTQNNLSNNNLIVDFNSNIDTTSDINLLSYMDKSYLSGTSTNLVISLDGSSFISTADLIGIANRDTLSGTNFVDNSFSFDLWFNYSQITNRIPLVSFIDSTHLKKGGFKIYLKSIPPNDIKLYCDYLDTDNNIRTILINTTGVPFNINNWFNIFVGVTNQTLNWVIYDLNSNIIYNNSLILPSIKFKPYDLNFIAKDYYNDDNTAKLTSQNFIGKIDEVRFWYTNLYSLFNVVTNTPIQKVKLLNRYVPELVAYYSSEIQTPNTYYPDAESIINFDSKTSPIEVKSLDGVKSFSSEDIFIELNFIAERKNNQNLITLYDNRGQNDSTAGYNQVNLITISLIDNSTSGLNSFNKFNLNIEELVMLGLPTLKTLATFRISNEFAYFEKHKLIITKDSIWMNGLLINNYNFTKRNIFVESFNSGAYLNAWSYNKIYNLSDTAIPALFNTSKKFNGVISSVNIWKSSLDENNYVIFKIRTNEFFDKLNIYNDDKTLLNPPIVVNGKIPYTTDVYFKENDYTEKLNSINKPSYFTFDNSNNFTYTDTMNSSVFPLNDFLSGTDFTSYTNGNNINLNSTSFSYFNQNLSNVNDKLSLYFSNTASVQMNYDGYPSGMRKTYQDNNFVESSSNLIAVAHNVVRNLGSPSGYMNYSIADRVNETVIKYDFIQSTSGNFVRNYVALRLDKINNSILFYNRVISDSNSTTPFIQGLRKQNGTTIGVPNYISGSIRINDENSLSLNESEYVLFLPRFNTNITSELIQNICNDNYSGLSSKGISNYISMNGYVQPSIFNLVVDTQLNDSTSGLIGLYVKSSVHDYLSDNYTFNGYSTSGIINNYSTSGLLNTIIYPLSEQFVKGVPFTNVHRSSYFYDGKFSSNIWYGGIQVAGDLSSDKLIFKYGIKHDGTINNSYKLKKNWATWLGGYHISDSDRGAINNIIWYRGELLGGKADRINVMSVDLNNTYFISDTAGSSGADLLVNNDWSSFTGTEFNRLEIYNSQVFETSSGKLVRLNKRKKKTDLLLGVLYKYEYSNDLGNTWLPEDFTSQIPLYAKNILFTSGENVYATTIESNSVNINLSNGSSSTAGYNEFDMNNWNTIIQGGQFISDNIINNTYTSQFIKDFDTEQEDNVLLNKVNTLMLGGLWLRGEFNGGILYGVLFNSFSVSSTMFNVGSIELKSGYKYDKRYSTIKRGGFFNSIFEGGVVDAIETSDVQFGELSPIAQTLNLDITDKIPSDNNGYEIPTTYKLSENRTVTEYVLGLNLFNIKSYGKKIDLYRIRSYDSNGLLISYFRRGEFKNGIMQFTYAENRDLNGVNSTLISRLESQNNTIFRKGVISNSYIDGGLYYAVSSSTSYPLNQTPGTIVLYSNFNKVWWLAVGLTNTDTSIFDQEYVKTTDAYFYRSIWSSGVWEGGIFEQSVWRSGTFDTNIKLNWFGNETSLIKAVDVGLNENMVYGLPNTTDNWSGTSIKNELNGSNFIISISSNINNVRYVGNIDNFASIWVNGHMKGSIYHGGIFMRGIFGHSDLVNDIFDYSQKQRGLWCRGIMLSGEFGLFDERVGDITNELNTPRSIFTGIHSENYIGGKTDRQSLIGLTISTLEDINNNTANRNDISSLISRRLFKNGSDKYLTKFNGSFIFGSLDYSGASGKTLPFFSAYSSIGNYYTETTKPIIEVSTSLKFKKVMQITPVIKWAIPYEQSNPKYCGGLEIITPDKSNTIINRNIDVINGFGPSSGYIIRHNSLNYGDGTIISSLPSVNWNLSIVKVSTAVGAGQQLIKGSIDPAGDNRHIGTFVNLNGDIGDPPII